MKLHAHPLLLKPELLNPPTVDLRRWVGAGEAVRTADELTPIPARRRGLSKPLRWVGLLAFGQSILFLVIWLFMCAHLGAAENNPAEPELRLSAFEPQNVRDPFMPPGAAVVGAATVPVGAGEFKLQGILFHPTSPSAMINNKLIYLNKPVTVRTAVGEVEIEATDITRNVVRLKIGGETVELGMAPVSRPRPETDPAGADEVDPLTTARP